MNNRSVNPSPLSALHDAAGAHLGTLDARLGAVPDADGVGPFGARPPKQPVPLGATPSPLCVVDAAPGVALRDAIRVRDADRAQVKEGPKLSDLFGCAPAVSKVEQRLKLPSMVKQRLAGPPALYPIFHRTEERLGKRSRDNQDPENAQAAVGSAQQERGRAGGHDARVASDLAALEALERGYAALGERIRLLEEGLKQDSDEALRDEALEAYAALGERIRLPLERLQKQDSEVHAPALRDEALHGAPVFVELPLEPEHLAQRVKVTALKADVVFDEFFDDDLGHFDELGDFNDAYLEKDEDNFPDIQVDGDLGKYIFIRVQFDLLNVPAITFLGLYPPSGSKASSPYNNTTSFFLKKALGDKIPFQWTDLELRTSLYARNNKLVDQRKILHLVKNNFEYCLSFFHRFMNAIKKQVDIDGGKIPIAYICGETPKLAFERLVKKEMIKLIFVIDENVHLFVCEEVRFLVIIGLDHPSYHLMKGRESFAVERFDYVR